MKLLPVLLLFVGAPGALSQIYTLEVLLENFTTGGYLSNGAHCDPFWFTGVDRCDITLNLCVEPMTNTTPGMGCSTQKIDLQRLTNNQNSIKFQPNTQYGGWYNPLRMTINLAQWKGFQVKVWAYDVDNGGNQLIDMYSHQFADGSSHCNFANYSHPRTKPAPPTFFKLAYSLIGLCQKTAPTVSPTVPVNGTTVVISGSSPGSSSAAPTTTPAPRDCHQIYLIKKLSGLSLAQRSQASGYYNITVNGHVISVYCDMTAAQGYTYIQRRVQDGYPFNKNYAQYLNYFGNPSGGSYWLGLNNIVALLNGTSRPLRIGVQECTQSGQIYEYYSSFSLGPAPNFTLSVSNGTTGTTATLPGDALNVKPGFGNANNHMGFSAQGHIVETYPNRFNCTQTYQSGWWFSACGAANLNAPMAQNCTFPNVAKGHTVRWNTLIPPGPTNYSITSTSMAVL